MDKATKKYIDTIIKLKCECRFNKTGKNQYEVFYCDRCKLLEEIRILVSKNIGVYHHKFED